MEFADIWLNVPTALQKSGGIYVIRAGVNRAKPNYHVGPRMIVCHSLHFVLEGSVLLDDGESRHVLHGGDIFCLFPYKSYVYRIAGGEAPLRMAWLAVEGEQVPLLIRRTGFREDAPYVRQRLTSRVRGTLRQILHWLSLDDKDELLLQSLLYKLFGQLSPARRGTPSLGPGKDWIRKSLDYFHLHFTENIKIEDAAQRAGMHRSYFSTAFAKEVGMSPRQFLQRLRLEQGAKLLRETELSVTEIALSLGYADLYSFTRAFSNYFGLPPSEYRANNGFKTF